MAYETILYEKKGRIAYITLNRPRILNAYNDTMGDELLDAHTDFDQDDDLHVLIVSGAGRAFCSGADVKQRQLRPLDEMKRMGGPDGSLCQDTQAVKFLEVGSGVLAHVASCPR